MKELLEKIFKMIGDFFSQSGGTVSGPVVKITYIPQLGDNSENTKSLQEKLVALGYDLKTDGSFGPKTLEAVKTFQKANGLSGSGMLGEKTIELLSLEVESVFTGTIINNKIYEVAQKEIGVKEIAGSKHNPDILKYHATTGKYSDDETPWCGSFVSWVLRECGLATLGALGAGARNWLKYGSPTKNPKLGDLAIFWRGSKDGWQGHVAFFISETDSYIQVLGGNQNDQVSIAAYKKSQLLGYRTYS